MITVTLTASPGDAIARNPIHCFVPWAAVFKIFDLSHFKFELVLYTVSRISQEIDEMYTQVLDVPKTIKLGGRQFCFTKTTMVGGGKFARPVRRTHPCYQRGEGVDLKEAGERNKMLAPLRKP